MNANKLNRGGRVARWARGRRARMSGYVLLPGPPNPRSSAFICGFQAVALSIVVLTGRRLVLFLCGRDYLLLNVAGHHFVVGQLQ